MNKIWKRIKKALKVAFSENKCIPTESPEWLDIIWKGKMVEINGKGVIRDKKTKRHS